MRRWYGMGTNGMGLRGAPDGSHRSHALGGLGKKADTRTAVRHVRAGTTAALTTARRGYHDCGGVILMAVG